MRFLEAFDRASLAGRIVLSVGSHRRQDEEVLAHLGPQEREATLERLAELHRHKIDLADEVLVINVGGYVGESTRAEIECARRRGRPVRWLEPQAGDGSP